MAKKKKGNKLAKAGKLALDVASSLLPGGKALQVVKQAYNVASAVNNAYQQSKKGKKMKKKNYKEKLLARQRLYEEQFKSNEDMIYRTRQMNRKRHVKTPISTLQFWDNMREFEKQVQLQTISQARNIWDKNLERQIKNKKAEEKKLDALDKERHTNQNKSLHDTVRIERIMQENPDLRAPLEKWLREKPTSTTSINDADYLLNEAQKRLPAYINKAALYRQDVINYELEKKKPGAMIVGIAPEIKRAAICNALASKTNYTMLDNPAFLERGDRTYRVVKKFVRLKKSILKFIFSDLFYSVLIGNSLLYQSLHLSDRSSLRIQLNTFFSIFYAKSHRLI